MSIRKSFYVLGLVLAASTMTIIVDASEQQEARPSAVAVDMAALVSSEQKRARIAMEAESESVEAHKQMKVATETAESIKSSVDQLSMQTLSAVFMFSNVHAR